MVFYLLGAYYGMVNDAKYFKGSVRTVNQTSIVKTILRLLLSAIPIVIVFVLPEILIASRSVVLPIFLSKYALPSYIIGFLLFGYSKRVYQRYNLVNIEDTNVILEKGLNMGRFEEQEDVREFTGKKNSKLYEEGLLESSTY